MVDDVYYSVLPPQQGEEKSHPEARLVNYKGVSLYASPYDQEHYQIQQLCSTNPAHYLRQELQPGQLITLIERADQV